MKSSRSRSDPSFAAEKEPVVQVLEDFAGQLRIVLGGKEKLVVDLECLVHVAHTLLHTNVGLVLDAGGSKLDVSATGQ